MHVPGTLNATASALTTHNTVLDGPTKGTARLEGPLYCSLRNLPKPNRQRRYSLLTPEGQKGAGLAPKGYVGLQRPSKVTP